MEKVKAVVVSVSMVAACCVSKLVLATNGMDMEGYGAQALGMGGASMAYDNGTAAMMNNPATMGLMDDGRRADLAFGFLGPDVESSAGGHSSKSTADAFSMPAFGWIEKRNGIAYGFGIYGQGGMGTEYGGNSIFANPANQAVSPHLVNRSEVSLGRVILPLVYTPNRRWSIGGSLDYVWAGMDLKMAMAGAEFLKMAQGASPMGSASGSMVQSFVTNVMPSLAAVNYGYFDFSNDNRFTGQAVATGYAAKIGLVFRPDDQWSFGAVYQSKTRLSDLTAEDASVLFNVDFSGGGPANQNIPVSGKIAVRDFQWPETMGFGVSYQATDRLQLALDYKFINWADTMKDFKMTFTAQGNTGMAAAFNGTSMDVTLHQNWSNQNIVMVGGAYRLTDALTLRGGVNMANNPVPATYLNYLFPAIIRNHVTAGLGYAFSKASTLDFAYSHAPEVAATSGVTGVTTRHSQDNWQLVYSYHY